MATRLGALVGFCSLAAFCFASAQTRDTAAKNCTSPKVISSPTFSLGHPLKNSLQVILNIAVSEKGLVDDPKVVKSSGHVEFDGIATDNVRKWKFKPAACDGELVSTRIIVKVDSPTIK